MRTTLSPAYGRDYKSGMAAKLDLAAGKDFIIRNAFDRYDGKPVNLEQLRSSGYTSVQIRFAGNAKAIVVDISKNIE